MQGNRDDSCVCADWRSLQQRCAFNHSLAAAELEISPYLTIAATARGAEL
jgi:hypothetical protein